MPDMIPLTGNTYAVKDRLKALGCVWNSARKCWLAPAEVAEEAQAIVPPATARCGGIRVARVCATCRCKINYGVYCGKCEYGR